MSSTLSQAGDDSYSNIKIRFNFSQALIEEEQQAQADPYASLNKAATEQYNLLVEL